MIKIFLPCASLLIAISTYSQVEFGIIAGPQMTSAKYNIVDINEKKIKQKTEGKFGFQVGGTMRVQFDGKLFFSPAVYFSMKGYKVAFNRSSFPPDTAAVDNDVSLHTFELAPILQYNFSDAPAHFFIKAGPSIDLQLSGKEKFNKTGGSSESRNLKFSYSDYGRFGANLLLHFGYETSNGLIIFAHYTHGIGSIVNADNGPLVLHRAVGISIGKYFNRK